MNNLAKSSSVYNQVFSIDDLIEFKRREEDVINASKYKKSLYEFFKACWPFIGRGNVFVDNWHIEAICLHLEACFYRKIKKLIVNVPPGTGKSILGSVVFPIWCWLNNSKETFLMASYGAALSGYFADDSRKILKSDWFLRLFGNEIRISRHKDSQHIFENTKGGYRITTSVGGVVTGFRSGIKILDDPSKAEDKKSKSLLDNINSWFVNTWSSRTIDAKTAVDIIIMQRISPIDLTEFLLSKDKNSEITHLCLMNEYDPNRKCKTIVLPNHTKVWQDPRTKAGELLCEKTFGKLETQRMKHYDNETYLAHYQQHPVHPSGQLIKTEWFSLWDKDYLPQFSKIIQSWDTAFKANESSDYSVCTTWGVFLAEPIDKPSYNAIMLLSLFRDRLSYPDLRKRAYRLYRNIYDVKDSVKKGQTRAPDVVLIEDRASGQSLIQDLYRAGVRHIQSSDEKDRGKDKVQRAHMVTHLIENGLVYVQNTNDTKLGAELLLQECSSFPNARNDDIVDSFVYALLFAKKNNILRAIYDPIISQSEDYSDLSSYNYF